MGACAEDYFFQGFCCGGMGIKENWSPETQRHSQNTALAASLPFCRTTMIPNKMSLAAVLFLACASAVLAGGLKSPCKSKGCGPGEFIPIQSGFFFGKECKSGGCGVLRGPGGDTFFGAGCKSKGCPLTPGFPIPGLSPSPRPSNSPRPKRRPPVCCTPGGCLRGYRTQCMAGALTPRLATLGYYSAGGSCSGALKKFPCRRAEVICTGNRGRCVYKKCRGQPRPSRSPRPRRSKSPKPSHPPHYPHRLLNVTEEMSLDLISTQRQTSAFCKSKGCPFGPPDQIIFGGACKSKGCGIVNTPNGPIFFGGGCKSKGCPLPPGFFSPSPVPRPSRRPTPPRPRPSRRPLPPGVPPFRPPRKGQCCFARPCNTQRICRCVLSRN